MYCRSDYRGETFPAKKTAQNPSREISSPSGKEIAPSFKSIITFSLFLLFSFLLYPLRTEKGRSLSVSLFSLTSSARTYFTFFPLLSLRCAPLRLSERTREIIFPFSLQQVKMCAPDPRSTNTEDKAMWSTSYVRVPSPFTACVRAMSSSSEKHFLSFR